MTAVVRSRPRRGSVASIVAALLLVTVGGQERAFATENVQSQRLGGSNRYATAGGVALAAFPEGVDHVVLASGVTFADALAGAPLAGALGGPLLLTAADHLSPEARQAIDRLGASAVTILGGPGAVSASVEEELQDLEVDRVAGPTRYATAGAVAAAIGADGIADVDGLRTALIASGRSFPDALAGGSIGANGGGDGVLPILLVDDGVPVETAAAIDELGVEHVVILGGRAAVSDEVERELEDRTGNDASRLAGTNRWETAARVGEAFIDDFGASAEGVILANGESFADALAGGVLAAVAGHPLVLTERVALPDASEDFVADHADTIGLVTALGGTAAVSESTVEEAERAAETPPEEAPNAIAVTPTSSASQANTTSRTYTVSGLDPDATVDIALMACESASITSGERAFRNTNTNGVADGSARTLPAPDLASTVARITSVNGTVNGGSNDDYARDAAATADGTVTFVVAGPSSATAQGGCVVPVAFDDADDDAALAVTTANPGSPTEDAGVGGQTTFNPQSGSGSGSGSASPGSPLTRKNVTRQAIAGPSSDEGRNRFEACAVERDGGATSPEISNPNDCALYTYDSNDVFKLDNQTVVTLDTFERYLSRGDDVQGRTQSASSAVAEWVLTDEAPTTPANERASATDEHSARITFTEPPSAIDGGFRVYRHVPAGTASCPTDRNSYAELVATDDPIGPNAPHVIEVGRLESGTRHCFVIVSIDELDESSPTPPLTVTTPGPPSGEPTPLPVPDVPVDSGGGPPGGALAARSHPRRRP